MGRIRLTVDPKWVPVDLPLLDQLWAQMESEAEQLSYIGFDMEWTTKYEVSHRSKGNGRRHYQHVTGPVATIQLSSQNVTIVLRYCDIIECVERRNDEKLKSLCKKIDSLLRKGSVYKVGVGINGDKVKLEKDYPSLQVCGCIDLVTLHQSTYQPQQSGEPAVSLKGLYKLYTQKELSKDTLIIRSNWGGNLGCLSPSQIEYAAADSEASFDICNAILQNVDDKSSLETLLSSKLEDSKLPKDKHKRRVKDPMDWCKGRSKPYYDNINVLDPDGKIVFTVDKAKALWYVNRKKLGTIVEWRVNSETQEEEVSAVQLSFYPDSEKYEDAHIRRNLDYFKKPKENACVVCGRSENFVRFAVVPLLYRRHFPSVYLSHNSYDLLLLCPICFVKANAAYDEERCQVEKDFGIPLAHLTDHNLMKYKKEIDELEVLLHDECRPKEDSVDDTIAHHMTPLIKLSTMKEYYAMQRHRNMIIQLIKYANAIVKHFKALLSESQQSSGTTPSFGVLPDERLEELTTFIESNAYTYPFCEWKACNTKASSFEGASIIIGERGDYQGVLRLFLVREYPDLVAELPSRTRSGKQDSSINSDLPAMESHGFFVIRSLFKKYSSQFSKNSEKGFQHAVGQFIYRWRTVFIGKLNPQFLPEGWVAEDGILQ